MWGELGSGPVLQSPLDGVLCGLFKSGKHLLQGGIRCPCAGMLKRLLHPPLIAIISIRLGPDVNAA